MISVVTPSFRQSDWLRLCVASVTDQAGVKVEHIVQDAGTDGIEQLLAGKSIRLFVEKDAGMYDAINRGLHRARGQICAYLNCDEQYLPGALAKVEAHFAAHPATDVLFGDVVLVDRAGTPISYRRAIPPDAAHVRSSHLNTNSCAMFFRRQIVERGFLFDTHWKTIGDAVWIESLLRAGCKMATLPEPLAVFTFTGSNLGSSELSEAEKLEWRGPDSPLKKMRSLSSMLQHRLRKARAGAYRRRSVAVDVFTLESPTARKHVVRQNVGFSWPTE